MALRSGGRAGDTNWGERGDRAGWDEAGPRRASAVSPGRPARPWTGRYNCSRAELRRAARLTPDEAPMDPQAPRQPSLLDPQLLWATIALVATLLLAAVIFAWVDRWRKRLD